MSIAEAISQLSEDKGISQDLIRKIIEDFLITAYEKTFHTSDNAIVRFNDIDNEPALFARKHIVEKPIDPVLEIALADALNLNVNSEIGDELLIEIDPKDFDRQAIQSAKQRAKQYLSNIQKDVLYSEFGDKVGKIVVGYIQREQDGNIYVNLGSIEGVIPKKYQSPREEYRIGDRIKAIIHEVDNVQSDLAIVLSRVHTDFVRRIFELEVPEIQEKIIGIHDIVREAGYRTKLAVFAHRSDVDPVGACVGVRGARIQAIIKELEGEKIDIVNYSDNVVEFIANTLSPARVEHVQVVDEKTKTALAIVDDDQFPLAIGKHGLNVRLANKLVGWNIDVKSRKQVSENADSSKIMKEVAQLFVGTDSDTQQTRERDEDMHVSELEGITPSLVLKLQDSRIEYIHDLLVLDMADRAKLVGLTEDEVVLLEKIIAENTGVTDDAAEQK